jgi:hypothetical protein
MLIFYTARLWIHSQDFITTETWRRVVFGFIVAALVVIAASVLTQMRIKFFADIDKSESNHKG